MTFPSGLERALAVVFLIVLAATAALPLSAQTTVSIAASADTTLYESAAGALANGGGQFLFVGNTNEMAPGDEPKRRALIAFDIAGAVPAGATIDSVTLELAMDRTIVGNVGVDLHRVSASWNEGSTDAAGQEGKGGPAVPGDATWLHRDSPGTAWTAAGGDYVPAASATATVGGAGTYTWSSATMTVDVQAWLDAPATSHGWLLRTIEFPGAAEAKRFISREGAAGPVLRVTYSGVAGPAAPIPALPLSGLIALAVVLALAGISRLRRP